MSAKMGVSEDDQDVGQQVTTVEPEVVDLSRYSPEIAWGYPQYSLEISRAENESEKEVENDFESQDVDVMHSVSEDGWQTVNRKKSESPSTEESEDDTTPVSVGLAQQSYKVYGDEREAQVIQPVHSEIGSPTCSHSSCPENYDIFTNDSVLGGPKRAEDLYELMLEQQREGEEVTATTDKALAQICLAENPRITTSDAEKLEIVKQLARVAELVDDGKKVGFNDFSSDMADVSNRMESKHKSIDAEREVNLSHATDVIIEANVEDRKCKITNSRSEIKDRETPLAQLSSILEELVNADATPDQQAAAILTAKIGDMKTYTEHEVKAMDPKKIRAAAANKWWKGKEDRRSQALGYASEIPATVESIGENLIDALELNKKLGAAGKTQAAGVQHAKDEAEKERLFNAELVKRAKAELDKNKAIRTSAKNQGKLLNTEWMKQKRVVQEVFARLEREFKKEQYLSRKLQATDSLSDTLAKNIEYQEEHLDELESLIKVSEECLKRDVMASENEFNTTMYVRKVLESQGKDLNEMRNELCIKGIKLCENHRFESESDEIKLMDLVRAKEQERQSKAHEAQVKSKTMFKPSARPVLESKRLEKTQKQEISNLRENLKKVQRTAEMRDDIETKIADMFEETGNDMCNGCMVFANLKLQHIRGVARTEFNNKFVAAIVKLAKDTGVEITEEAVEITNLCDADGMLVVNYKVGAIEITKQQLEMIAAALEDAVDDDKADLQSTLGFIDGTCSTTQVGNEVDETLEQEATEAAGRLMPLFSGEDQEYGDNQSDSDTLSLATMGAESFSELVPRNSQLATIDKNSPAFRAILEEEMAKEMEKREIEARRRKIEEAASQ